MSNEKWINGDEPVIWMWFQKFLFKYASKNTSQDCAVSSLNSTKAVYEATTLSISVSSLASQPAQRARHQYLIGVQGTLQLPSSTSWSGQLHWGAGEETAWWKRPEQVVPTDFWRLTVSREPAGNVWLCTISLRWHREGTTGIHLKIS